MHENDLVANSLDLQEKALSTIAVSSDTPWDTIGLLRSHTSTSQLLGIFPSYLQIDLRFYRAVRALRMSSLTVAPEQMLAGLALIEPLSIGGIVITAGALDYCIENMPALPPELRPYFQVVLSPLDRPRTCSTYRMYYEFHSIPGIPLLYQCPFLSPNHFHATPSLDIVSFPHRLSRIHSSCACGSDSTFACTYI